MNLQKLLLRAFSGTIYVVIILAAIWGGIPTFSCLVALLAILSAIEFIKITQGLQRERLWMISLDITITLSLALCSTPYLPYFLPIALMMIRFIATIYSKQKNPLRSLSYSVLTVIYIGTPLSVLNLLMGTQYGWLLVLAMFIFIWINDTGAFIVGCTLGRHKLFERISPKKSWEGFIGGLTFNLGAAILFYYFLPEIPSLNLLHWIAFSVIVTMCATWGDLIESLMKRTLHLKDSGNMIPGHGGILDRIDSLLLVAPSIFLFYFYICGVSLN